ncbi:c-type cytochrome [Fontimonas sp. SYSU GA230001]|uniref:c-type cytochrome n=1 Tax=Fontimonas sp. SYSU GA230001 TaxID=3142450 RepID=UPI0032B4937E
MNRLHVGLCALTLLASACGKSESPPPAALPATAVAAPVAADPAVQRLYEQTCKACHGVPGTGAPLAGDAAAWAPRVAQGLDTLLDHTINGYKGMPPLGSCGDCSEDEFRALIRHMAQLP